MITTSGALATLLFALAALSTKESDTFELPVVARDWLLGALVMFVLCGCRRGGHQPAVEI